MIGRLFTRRSVRCIAGLALIAALPVFAVRAETLDNDRVVALTKANVGDAAVIAKINSMPCGYDVSVAQLARLKRAKVSSPVLAAMIRRCQADGRDGASVEDVQGQRAGVYLQRLPGGHFELARIEPAYVTPGSGGGNGSLLFPAKSKLSLPGRSAQTVAHAYRPVFYFFLAEGGRHHDGFGNEPLNGARDPSEFNLVRFQARSTERELVVEKASALGASAANLTAFSSAFKISPPEDGAYRVEIVEALEPGQYAFIERLNGGAYRVYDFEIPARDH